MRDIVNTDVLLDTSAEDNSVFDDAVKDLPANYTIGDTVEGVITSIEKEGVLLDIKYKSDAFMPNNEVPKLDIHDNPIKLAVGDTIHVTIVRLETKEGYTLVSGKKAIHALTWDYLKDISKTGDSIRVVVSNQVEGGLVAQFNTIKGFIPSSHVIENSSDDLGEYLQKEIEVVVLSVDQKKKKVVFSAKKARQKPTESEIEEAEAFFKDLDSGQVLKGTVTNVKDFGVFVDIGHNVEGLVHVSELSWTRVRHPSDVISIGDVVRVFILGVSPENRRISLGMKQLQPDPWLQVKSIYKEGQIVSGTITRVTTFGAFFELSHGIEGLIHISKLSHDRVDNVRDVVKEGDKYNAKIVKFYPDKQKIGLSLVGVDQSELVPPSIQDTEKK